MANLINKKKSYAWLFFFIYKLLTRTCKNIPSPLSTPTKKKYRAHFFAPFFISSFSSGTMGLYFRV